MFDQSTDQSAKYVTNLRVRYAETDQMGVVYYANYLIWMEVGRVELLRSRGFNYKDLEAAEGLFLAVVDVSCRYHSAARYDEQIAVQRELTESSARMVKFAYEIRSSDTGRVFVTGSTSHIWLDRQWRPARLPDSYRSAIRIG